MGGGGGVRSRGSGGESEVGRAVALHERGVESPELQSLGNGGLYLLPADLLALVLVAE